MPEAEFIRGRAGVHTYTHARMHARTYIRAYFNYIRHRRVNVQDTLVRRTCSDGTDEALQYLCHCRWKW